MTDRSTVTLSGEPFDPTTVDLDHPQIGLRFYIYVPPLDDDGNKPKEIAGLFVCWIYSYKPSAEKKPEWAVLPLQDRLYVELPMRQVDHIVHSRIGNYGIGNTLLIDLPCPPYDYEIDDDLLTITSGPFTKTGTKDEWQAVVSDMQVQIDDIPDSINLSGLADVPINILLEVIVEKRIDVLELLEGSSRLTRGNVWLGTQDELVSAIEDGADGYCFDIELKYEDYNVITQAEPEAYDARDWVNENA